MRNNRGFTLIETLVAVAILTLAIVGPLTAVSSAVSSATYATDQVKAYYLGEEAIEIIRAVRDNNSLSGVDWLTGINSVCFEEGKTCSVDIVTAQFYECSPTLFDTCVVYSDESTADPTHFHRQHQTGGNWQDTGYKRTVHLTGVDHDATHPGNEELVVQVVVSWKSGAVSRSITISENMFDWK